MFPGNRVRSQMDFSKKFYLKNILVQKLLFLKNESTSSNMRFILIP